jgi:ankyrin repeat protein
LELRSLFNKELFPKNGSLKNLKRLGKEALTQMLAEKILPRHYGSRPDAREVDMLLQAGADPEYVWPNSPYGPTDYSGVTMLGVAARRGLTDCVRALLRHGADRNAVAPNGLIPLQQAAYLGEAEVLGLFLNEGADTGLRTPEGMTLMMLVVNGLGGNEGRRRCLELLLGRGADPEEKNNAGQTAMDYFYRNRYAYSDTAWAEPLREAVRIREERRKKEETQRRFMKLAGGVGRPGGEFPPSALKGYLEQGVDIEAVDDFWKTTPLGIFCVYNMKEQAKLLLEAGANVNPRHAERGSTPLMSAASSGYAELAQMLIGYGADVNETDREGATPLIHATRYGCRTEAIKVLLANGARVDVADKEGKTALHYAREGQSDHRNYGGRTGREAYTELEHILLRAAEPQALLGLRLAWAAERGETDTMKELISRGADINGTEGLGRTALMLALVPVLQREAVQLLLEKGALLDIRDGQGATVLDLCRSAKQGIGIKDSDAPKRKAYEEMEKILLEAAKQQDLQQYETGLRAVPAPIRLKLRKST